MLSVSVGDEKHHGSITKPSGFEDSNSPAGGYLCPAGLDYHSVPVRSAATGPDGSKRIGIAKQTHSAILISLIRMLGVSVGDEKHHGSITKPSGFEDGNSPARGYLRVLLFRPN